MKQDFSETFRAYIDKPRSVVDVSPLAQPMAQTLVTPTGVHPAPLDPGFTQVLAQCRTNEDLFQLVDVEGLIQIDAFNEVVVRGLYAHYLIWRETFTVGKEHKE